MNRKDLSKIVYIAEHTNFGEQFGERAGVLADRVHAYKTWGEVDANALDVAALFKWQSLQFNGQWDLKALEETYEWLKMAVKIVDIDEKYAEVKQVVELKEARGHEPKFEVNPVADSRFGKVEL